MKTISFNSYCRKTDKLIKELTEDMDVLTDCKDMFFKEHMDTTKDARIRLEALSSLKKTARRINTFLNEVK